MSEKSDLCAKIDAADARRYTHSLSHTLSLSHAPTQVLSEKSDLRAKIDAADARRTSTDPAQKRRRALSPDPASHNSRTTPELRGDAAVALPVIRTDPAPHRRHALSPDPASHHHRARASPEPRGDAAVALQVIRTDPAPHRHCALSPDPVSYRTATHCNTLQHTATHCTPPSSSFSRGQR